MPLVSGPELDEVVRETREWYAQTRAWLIDRLSEGYPFGSAKLSPLEQVTRFRERLRDPAQMKLFVSQLEDRYKGLPDKRERVQRDLEAYFNRMRRYEAEIGASEGLVLP